MSTLKAKTALNKLLKGEILYHSVYDEKIEPVQMVDGKTINPDTGMDWSFSDFTQFYKSKELGEKDLKQKKQNSSLDYNMAWEEKEAIAQKKKNDQDKAQAQRKQEQINNLMPIMNELNKACASKGLSFKMHTNERHYPCPAIHMVHSSYPLSELCGEIYITDYDSKGTDYIKSGSCNMHRNKSKDVQDLINKIMDCYVQQKVSA